MSADPAFAPVCGYFLRIEDEIHNSTIAPDMDAADIGRLIAVARKADTPDR